MTIIYKDMGISAENNKKIKNRIKQCISSIHSSQKHNDVGSSSDWNKQLILISYYSIIMYSQHMSSSCTKCKHYGRPLWTYHITYNAL